MVGRDGDQPVKVYDVRVGEPGLATTDPSGPVTELYVGEPPFESNVYVYSGAGREQLLMSHTRFSIVSGSPFEYVHKS